VVTEFNHTAARPGVTYYYWITACDGIQCSGYSAYDSGWRTGVRLSLAAPEITASGGVHTDCVRLMWAPVAEATVYQIERTVPPSVERESIGSTSETMFDDLSAAPGVDYVYRVTPCTDEGCGEVVQEVWGWRGLTPPEALKATLSEAGDRVLLTWMPSEGATVYQLSRAAAGDNGKQLIGWTEIPEFEDPVDVQSGRRSYWVQACTDVHCSDYSVPAVTSADFLTYLPVVVKE
jgi:hypothetical protein